MSDDRASNNDSNKVTTKTASASNYDDLSTKVKNDRNKKFSKRPTKEVYVPRGRRSLVENNKNQQTDTLPPQQQQIQSITAVSNNTLEVTTVATDAGAIKNPISIEHDNLIIQKPELTDPSIVGYLKTSPEKSEPKERQTDISKSVNNKNEELDVVSQLKSLNLNSIETKENNNENDDEDSWDNLYNESGECTNKKLIKEVYINKFNE